MKITTTSAALALSIIASAPILVQGDNVAVNSPGRMQRLTRRNAIDLSSSSSSSSHSRRNATTFVPRQDKVDSTVSNSTTSTTTIGDVVEKHFNEQVSPSGSPYNVANAIQLLHEGVVVPTQPKQLLVRRGEEKEDEKMSITSVDASNDGEDEECEEEEEGDDDEDEQCEDDDEDNDDEECEDDQDDDDECDADGDDDEGEEDCEDEVSNGDDGVSAPIGDIVDFGAIATPNNLAEGSLKAQEGCTKFTTAVSGDTCYKLIGAKDDELLKVFYKNNPSVTSGCRNLKIDSAYCVSSAPVSSPKTESGNKEEQPKKPEEEGEVQKPAPVVEQPEKKAEQQDKPAPVTPPVSQNNVVKEVKPDLKVETPVAVIDVKKEQQPKKEEGAVKKGTYDAKASYYYQHGNAGACGNKKSDNDYIVALHPSLYNNGARCGSKISLTNKKTGKTLTAEVADLCPTCEAASPGPQIDLSKKLFDDLSNGADGIFQVTYGFL